MDILNFESFGRAESVCCSQSRPLLQMEEYELSCELGFNTQDQYTDARMNFPSVYSPKAWIGPRRKYERIISFASHLYELASKRLP